MPAPRDGKPVSRLLHAYGDPQHELLYFEPAWSADGRCLAVEAESDRAAFNYQQLLVMRGHHFRPFQWRPAQKVAGIDPLRRAYDLRHTFATFALRAGISTFDLSRYMGASLTMIDRHYGHLARDGREHAIRLLDALSAGERPPWTLMDARWTLLQQNDVTSDNNSHAIAG